MHYRTSKYYVRIIKQIAYLADGQRRGGPLFRTLISCDIITLVDNKMCVRKYNRTVTLINNGNKRRGKFKFGRNGM